MEQLVNNVLRLSYRGPDGRYYYGEMLNADSWFTIAKRYRKVPDQFIVASVLSAMEVWDIIGLENEQ